MHHMIVVIADSFVKVP